MTNITAKLVAAQLIKTPHGDHVRGTVFNDAKGRFEEGEKIRTSTVVSIEDNIVLTRFSIYEVTWASEAAR